MYMYFLQEYLPKFWNSDFYRAGPLGYARQPVSWSGREEGGVAGAGGRGREEERRWQTAGYWQWLEHIHVYLSHGIRSHTIEDANRVIFS